MHGLKTFFLGLFIHRCLIVAYFQLVLIDITDRDRHSLERAIDCMLLQSTTRETHKFIGKLESSRIILI